MIEIIRSVIIGGIQGISEFLPISSSGHLVLIPYVFNWDYKGLSFDIALHFGTAIAIVAFFWHDWVRIIGNALKLKSDSKKDSFDLPSNFLWKILVASIPAAIIGVLLENYVEQKLHSVLLMSAKFM